MKILCPTDFSPRAGAAARLAVELARATGGSVELIHAVAPRLPAGGALPAGPGAGPVAENDPQRPAGEATRLADECRALLAGAVEVTSHLASGEPAVAIVARARAIGADLIVMGSHGGPALARLVLGSVAERTVRLSDRAVLIVPPGAAPALAPAGDGGRGGRPRILVALDGRPSSDGALGFVRTLRERLACDVTFLRLYWPAEEYLRLGLTGARDLFAPDVEVTTDLARTLRAEIGPLPGSGEIEFAIKPTWGDPATRILEIAAESGNDLVVMGAESRRGLARVAHPAVASRVAHLAANVAVVFAPQPRADGALPAVPTFSTVLVPTDLSEAGNRAVPFAYALVGAGGGQVEVCHVHERALPSPPYAYESKEGALSADARATLEARLRALVPPEAERLGITSHVRIVDGGRAAEAIRQAAERLGADAIVLGAHGHGRAHEALLGSVSGDVVRHARRPVFVIPAVRPGDS